MIYSNNIKQNDSLNYNNCNTKCCDKQCADCCNHIQDLCCNCPYNCCSAQLSAEFFALKAQVINVPVVTFVEFPLVAVPSTDCIRLTGKNTIELKPGRYSISYYTTIANSLDDSTHDDFTALIYVDSSPLEYTRSKIRLDDPQTEYIGFLSKTNLIVVEYTSTIQLGVQINDETFPDPVLYSLQNVAIVVQKIG